MLHAHGVNPEKANEQMSILDHFFFEKLGRANRDEQMKQRKTKFSLPNHEQMSNEVGVLINDGQFFLINDEQRVAIGLGMVLSRIASFVLGMWLYVEIGGDRRVYPPRKY